MKEILKFEAKWCGQCKAFTPIVDSVIKDITLTKVDVEENEDLVTHYKIRNLPTLVFLKDNTEVGRVTGILTKEALASKVKEYYGN